MTSALTAIDESANHVMQTSLLDSECVFLVWPKKATIRDLEHAREMVVFQLGSMIKFAKQKNEKSMAADAEYESWGDALRAKGGAA